MANSKEETVEPNYYSTKVGKNSRGKELGAKAPPSKMGVPGKGIKDQVPTPSKVRS